MLLELLYTTILAGFVGAIIYIIHLQRTLLAQTNHLNVRRELPQTRSADPIEAESRGGLGSQLEKRNPSSQMRSSGDDEDDIEKSSHSEKREASQRPNADSIDTETQGASGGNMVMILKSEEEIEHQNQSILTRALKEIIKKNSSSHQSLESLKIYKLNLHKISSNKISQITKFEFGKSATGSYGKNEKVIMILGATGSGKTTLINSMINYLFGVDYEDGFRFKLVTEDWDGGGNQAYNQPSWITAYTIHHQKGFKVPYTLTIIDTPGFGDTRGIERDIVITKQIHKFFTVPGKEGIDHIDAVGFVAQSSLPRLTFTQKYIFDQILSLFGKDIGENIYLLLTFADGKVPQVLNGIDEAHMPYQEFFKFNNSVIFDDNTAEDEFATMFWKMGMRSFEKFFDHFATIKSKSLTQTKSVLEEREIIEIQIIGLQSEIKRGLNKLEQLRKEVEVVQQHKADQARNEDLRTQFTRML